jgi:hypothetical protein
VGGWIPVGAHCESDAGILFRPDGSWLAYEESGTWTLVGDLLTTVTTHSWQSGIETGETLTQPERHSERIEVAGRDSYRSHRPNGEAVEIRRCRPQRD